MRLVRSFDTGCPAATGVNASRARRGLTTGARRLMRKFRIRPPAGRPTSKTGSTDSRSAAPPGTARIYGEAEDEKTSRPEYLAELTRNWVAGVELRASP